MKQELNQCQVDLRVEGDRRSGIAGVATEGERDRIKESERDRKGEGRWKERRVERQREK